MSSKIKLTLEERYYKYALRIQRRTRAGHKRESLRSFEAWKKNIEDIGKSVRKRRLDPKVREAEKTKSRERWRAKQEYYKSKQKEWVAENYARHRAYNEKWKRDNPTLCREQKRRAYQRTVACSIAKLRRGEATISEVSQRVRRSFTRLDGQPIDVETRGHRAGVQDSKAGSRSSEGEA